MQQKIQPQIEESWRIRLGEEFDKDYMRSLREFLLAEKKAGHTIYPPGNDIFRAFFLTPFDQVKVVILGQDPYHGPNQAHGLCFSVKPPTPPPPSLVNMYKELEADLQIAPASHGDLSSWARQGVLLLNTVLTVRAHCADSHKNRGWERFTDQVISLLVKEKKGIIFVLWGSNARKKKELISKDHFVIESSHPSPLSVFRGFFGSRPYSAINRILKESGEVEINWKLPDFLSKDE